MKLYYASFGMPNFTFFLQNKKLFDEQRNCDN